MDPSSSVFVKAMMLAVTTSLLLTLVNMKGAAATGELQALSVMHDILLTTCTDVMGLVHDSAAWP